MQSPFEKNSLPDFAKWLQYVIVEERPDALVPVGRKGTHLLDLTLDCLRKDHGFHARIPIQNRRSFYFTDPDHLSGLHTIVFDDATHSGKTLLKLETILKRCGVTNIKMIAFMGRLDRNYVQKRKRHQILCYKECDAEEYQENVWQISETIQNSAFSPEIDHHVFLMNQPECSLAAWDSLLDILKDETQLDYHGRVLPGKSIYGATVHWPSFFPEEILPKEGAIRRNGAIKLKVFADFSTRQMILIPMVYPELVLPFRVDPDHVDIDTCFRFFDAWAGGPDPVGRILLDRTRATFGLPEILLYAVSLSCEVEMIRQFTNLLARENWDSEQIDVSCDPKHFHLLYGTSLGKLLTATIDKLLSDNLRESLKDDRKVGPRFSSAIVSTRMWSREVFEQQDAINAEVIKRSNMTTLLLKKEWHERNHGLPEDEWESVGYSFGELMETPAFSKHPDGRLMLSRCLDYSCGNTILVPYNDMVLIEGNTVVSRRYRTSEQVLMQKRNGRGGLVSYVAGRHLEHVESNATEIAEEIVAAVSYFIQKQSRRWQDRPVPALVMNKILKILKGVCHSVERSRLAENPGDLGPEFGIEHPRLLGRPSMTRLQNVKSRHFRIAGDGGFDPTPAFKKDYKTGSLKIFGRREVHEIEGYLRELVSALDGASNVAETLTSWSISSGWGLGLEYPMLNVEDALKSLKEPLDVLLRGDSLDRKKIDKSVARALDLCGVAKGKIEDLQSNWSQQILDGWEYPTAMQRDLMGSILRPQTSRLVHETAIAFCVLVGRLSMVIQKLGPEVQPSLFESSGEETVSLNVIDGKIREMEVQIKSLRAAYVSSDHLPDDEQVRLLTVGGRMRKLVQSLKKYAYAYAMSPIYIGSSDIEEDVIPKSRSRTVLCADLGGATRSSLTLAHDSYYDWIEQGLRLVAQWVNAFGGMQKTEYPREGDKIFAEFLDPDSAVICATLVQAYLKSWRSISDSIPEYHVRIAIDSGRITNGFGDNAHSSAYNRASKIVDWVKSERDKDKLGAMDIVLVTPETVHDCSEGIRDCLSKFDHETLDLGADTPLARFVPHVVNEANVLDKYIKVVSRT